MEFLKNAAAKCRAAFHRQAPELDEAPAELTPWQKVKRVIGILVKICYHSRKVILTIPVAYYALRLAAYNMANLPQEVGLFLQADGNFMMVISRYLAVVGPLGLTAGCLVMMFLARKALYPWAISLFTLVLPVLLLVSNIYPA